jgi:integrase
VIRRLAAAANLPGAKRLRPHSLRVTAATVAYRRGADIVKLQAFLGHASIATTRRYLRDVDTLDGSPSYDLAGALVAEDDVDAG